MRELTVISGKGGTGKTSVVAALAALADELVLVDCDVETPNLHLLAQPDVQRTEDFVGGEVARLRYDLCVGCGRCHELCRFDAIIAGGPPNRLTDQTFAINGLACEGCGLCAAICPSDAIVMMPSVDGQWFESRTRFGPFVHARLRPGRGNSGKLVSLLRKHARTVAEESTARLILCDGVPGIGCTAIASIGGADFGLVVAEPSLAGLHDFERVIALAQHFSVPLWLCVNRYDINETLTERIEQRATEVGIPIVGRIPTDPAMLAAQRAAQTVVEAGDSPAADAIRVLWDNVKRHVDSGTIEDCGGEARTPSSQEQRS